MIPPSAEGLWQRMRQALARNPDTVWFVAVPTCWREGVGVILPRDLWGNQVESTVPATWAVILVLLGVPDERAQHGMELRAKGLNSARMHEMDFRLPTVNIVPDW